MSFQESQMSLIDDTAEVIKFLEMCREKQWLTDDATHCRLTACNKLFSVLTDDERNAEYVLKNLEKLVDRYKGKNTAIRQSTLKVYKSRLKSSVEEFLGWSQDPLGWEHTRRRRNPFKANPRPSESVTQIKAARLVGGKRSRTPVSNGPDLATRARRLSFPLRPDFDVEMVLPADGLTSQEIIRLGLFLYPYCKDLELVFPGSNKLN